MDFSLTPAQADRRAEFEDFAEREVAPRAAETDRDGRPPLDLLRKAAAHKWLGAPIPQEFGGAGLDLLSYMLLIESLARRCLSTAISVGIHTSLAGMALLAAGTNAQKARFLTPMAQGEVLGAFALTEPDAGSDPAALVTRACPEDGVYRLNGVKNWVSNAGIAGTHVVFAATQPGARRRGLTAFVVEAGTPGYVVGRREPTLGLRGLGIHTVQIADCRVPAEQRLGNENDAWPIITRVFDVVRLTLGAAALGAAEAALALGSGFAAGRWQFGSPLADKQAIQGFIAETAVDVEALRHLIEYAAWKGDRGQPFGREASMAKLFGARVANAAADRMLQVHGGYGFSDDYPISRIYRDVRALRLLGGTDEIQKFVVARGIMEEQGLLVRAA